MAISQLKIPATLEVSQGLFKLPTVLPLLQIHPNLQIFKVSFGGPYAPYWVIINDDYQNAVVWSCTSILGLGQVDYMWVLSRQNTMSSTTYQQLTSQAAAITGYDVSKLIPTAQAGCSYPTYE